MVREVTSYEARTEPPSIHATLEDAVTAEIAALMGWRKGGDESVIGLARTLVDRASDVLGCLSQLSDLEPPTDERTAS
jgi:hypothetical protein